MTRKYPSRVPGAITDLERSASVRRVAKVIIVAGSLSQAKIRPMKNRMLSSNRTGCEDVNGADELEQPHISSVQLFAVRRKSSSVTSPRQRGRSTAHTS